MVLSFSFTFAIAGRLGVSWVLSEVGKFNIISSARYMDTCCYMACFSHYLAAYCASNLYALLNDYIIIKKCPAASAISKVRLCSMCLDVDCNITRHTRGVASSC